MQRRRSGSAHPAGEKQDQPFQLSFNASPKMDFQGSRITSDGGLVLVPDRLSHDPTFRLIGSKQIWQRGAALTSRLQSFETDLLTQEENLSRPSEKFRF